MHMWLIDHELRQEENLQLLPIKGEIEIINHVSGQLPPSFFLRSSQRSNIEPLYELLSCLNAELVNCYSHYANKT